MHPTLLIAVLVVFTVAGTFGGVAYFRSWAEKRQLMDMPNERSSHTRPTPRGGGLVIVAITLLGGFILALALLSLPFVTAFLFYATGALLVAAISWIDDLRSLSSSMRLSVHLLGAVMAILGFGYWQNMALPLVGTVALEGWGIAAAAIWIVGLTNAFNFMDGTDGIAGSQALIAGLGWAYIGWHTGQPFVMGFGLVVAGSCLGFLFHNWPPARIFMGDVGSAFLGFTLAVLPLIHGSLAGSNSGTALAGLLLVWPFVFDTGFTFVRRLLRGENVFAAHRTHLYQRMSAPSSGHARVAILYSCLALLGVLLARFWTANETPEAAIGALALPLLCVGLWLLTVVFERRQAGGSQ